MAGAIALLLGLGAIAYCGWFFGRCQEAAVESREEQLGADAFEWAARHDKLPPPVIVTRYVDMETGEVVEERQV